MRLTDVQDNLEHLGLSKEQSGAILNLIDIKTSDDMKEVINEIRNQNIEIKRLEDKLETRYNVLIWAIGILMALMISLKFLAK